MLINCVFRKTIRCAKTIKNEFWIDVLKSYILFIEKSQLKEWEKIVNMPLRFNENFKVNYKHIFIPESYDNGFRLVKDILDE